MKDNTLNVIILTIIYLVGRAYNKEKRTTSLVNHESYRTYKIQKIVCHFKHRLLLNKMVLIKSFLTRALHDRSKLIYVHLNQGDKVREGNSRKRFY